MDNAYSSQATFFIICQELTRLLPGFKWGNLQGDIDANELRASLEAMRMHNSLSSLSRVLASLYLPILIVENNLPARQAVLQVLRMELLTRAQLCVEGELLIVVPCI